MGRPRKTTIDSTPQLKAPAEPFSITTKADDSIPHTADKVSNVTQKERAAFEAGLTRKKILAEVVAGLQAVKEGPTSYIDGVPHTEEVPDTAMRLKAAELGAKYFGDMKEFNVGPVTQHNKITVTWGPVTVIKNDVNVNQVIPARIES